MKTEEQVFTGQNVCRHPAAIQTFKGNIFSILYPDASQIDIRDIAKSLSQKCRFNGHCKFNWTVAQHSLLCAKISYESGNDIEITKWLLMHDAAEAYMLDVPSPIKDFFYIKRGGRFVRYRYLEDQISELLGHHFDMVLPIPHEEIKKIDNAVLAAEREILHDFQTWVWEPWKDIEPCEKKYFKEIKPQLEWKVYSQFVSVWKQLSLLQKVQFDGPFNS